ncbi:MAG: putative glycoside hydrolase [Acidimicrobiia bacterium]
MPSLLLTPDVRPRRPWRAFALLGVGLAALGGIGALMMSRNDLDARLVGIDDGAAIKPDAIGGIELRIEPVGGTGFKKATLSLNGVPLDVSVDGGSLGWVTPRLVEGDYELLLEAKKPVRGQMSKRWSFRVDGTAPTIGLPAALDPVPIDQPFVLAGPVDADAIVMVDDQPAQMGNGSFRFDYAIPPAGPVHVVAIDKAGNSSGTDVIVPVVHPPTRSIHATFNAWASESFRKQVYSLIADKRITAVQLDLKDETGQVGYDTDVALAKEIGARNPTYALKSAVDDIHARGARVIGRLVAFRDPILADAAWARGDQDWVLQTPDGQPLGAYGGFTNYVNAGVRKYNADLAIEAAQRGVDEVLWDYIRRPEGDPSTMVVPGLGDRVSSDVVADFLAETHAALRSLKVEQGASVFGIAASRPNVIAQDVPLMALHTDYIAPMVYPSHWNKGEYGVADPNRQPYDIVKRSLADFQKAMEGTNKPLMPWLQDFSQGVDYGVTEVAAQIRASSDLGIEGFLLWNPSSRYTVDALKPAA